MRKREKWKEGKFLKDLLDIESLCQIRPKKGTSRQNHQRLKMIRRTQSKGILFAHIAAGMKRAKRVLAVLSSVSNHDLWPGIWPSRPNLLSKDEAPDTYCSELTSERTPKWSQTTASLLGQITQPRPLAWHLTFKVKFHVINMTGYRISSRNYVSTCTKMVSSDI